METRNQNQNQNDTMTCYEAFDHDLNEAIMLIHWKEGYYPFMHKDNRIRNHPEEIFEMFTLNDPGFCMYSERDLKNVDVNPEYIWQYPND